MSGGDGLPTPRRWWAVLAISFGTGLLVMDNAIATVALPTIAEALNIERSSAVIIVTVYQLVLLMALLPFSALGDLIGHKRLYQGGQLLFLAATGLCVAADSLPVLLLARSCQALGVAAVLSVSMALLRAIYPAASLGRGLGLNSIIIASASALAPTLGGLILAGASWRWVFAAAAPFAALSLLAGAMLPNPPPSRTRFDLGGAVLCAATFGLVMGGLESGIHGAPLVLAAAVVGTGALLGLVFVRRERRSERPTLPVDLLARPVFALSTAAALLAFVGSMSFTLSLPFRLQNDHGFSVGAVGAIMAIWPLSMIVASPIAGRLSDRAPAGMLGGVGMACAAVGFLIFSVPRHQPDWTDFLAPMILCGVGFGLFIAPNSRQIVSAAPPDRTASAGALVSTTRLVGQTLGASLLAALLTASAASGAAPALVAAGLVAAAALCSFAHLALRRPAPAAPYADPGV